MQQNQQHMGDKQQKKVTFRMMNNEEHDCGYKIVLPGRHVSFIGNYDCYNSSNSSNNLQQQEQTPFVISKGDVWLSRQELEQFIVRDYKLASLVMRKKRRQQQPPQEDKSTISGGGTSMSPPLTTIIEQVAIETGESLRGLEAFCDVQCKKDIIKRRKSSMQSVLSTQRKFNITQWKEGGEKKLDTEQQNMIAERYHFECQRAFQLARERAIKDEQYVKEYVLQDNSNPMIEQQQLLSTGTNQVDFVAKRLAALVLTCFLYTILQQAEIRVNHI